MKLLVGLGNPGSKYAQTRHNLGFVVTNALVQKHSDQNDNQWKNSKKHHALIKQITINNQEITLMQPHTFMNNSGEAVQSYAQYFKINTQDIFVIYDDLALPIGKLRVRLGGSAGGHKGVQSVIDHLGTDEFLRIRLGIGVEEQPMPTEEFVLAPFSAGEERTIRSMIDRTVEAVELIMENGIEKYLSTHHGQ